MPFTPEQRKRSQRDAIVASCWGAIPQVMVNDSSVVILFATLLGAGEMISVMTSSLQHLSLCVLMIPLAYLSERGSKKRQIMAAAALGCVMLWGTAPAPWFGRYAAVVLLATLAAFSITISAYLAAWFPLLDGVVSPQERGLFFGRLRFSWQAVSALFVFASGAFLGQTASVGALQVIIALAALGLLGRFWYVNDMIEEKRTGGHVPWRAAWRDIIANRPLIGFSIYLFCLYAAANATIPVVFMFAKRRLALPDNLIVISSACVMGGLLAGFLAGGWMVHRRGVKPVFLMAHAGFGLLNLLLLTIHGGSWPSVVALVALITLYGFLLANASVAVSSEMLALSPANNKAMSIAFCYSLYSAGLGFSRFLASLILGSGALADTWRLGALEMTKYHTLFLAYGVGTLMLTMLLVLVPALTRNVQRLSEA